MANKKGELNTKIHLAVDAHGMPVRFWVTDATVADCSVAETLITEFQAEYLLAIDDTTSIFTSFATLSKTHFASQTMARHSRPLL